MKRIYAIILGVIMSSASLVAQEVPTVTSAANLQIGEQITVYDVNLTDPNPGPAGAEIIWDFVDLDSTNYQIASFVSPSTTDFSSDFPNTNVAIAYENGLEGGSFVTGYEYYNTSGVLTSLSGIVNNSGTVLTYTNAPINMIYPFSYQSSNFDEFASEYIVNGDLVNEQGSINIDGDGYGSLILPYGQIDDVVRMHTVMEYTQTIEGLGTFEYLIERYDWYHPELSYPLLTVISETFEDGVPNIKMRYVFYKDDLAVPVFDGLVEYVIGEAQLYPNPATTTALFNYDLIKPTNVTLNVYNTLGQIVTQIEKGQQTTGQYNIALDVQNYAKGMYLLEMQIDEDRLTKKFIVE
ncbi:MAG: T9SS type A sorting domain-containing protein [Chitinophagales bacterium]